MASAQQIVEGMKNKEQQAQEEVRRADQAAYDKIKQREAKWQIKMLVKMGILLTAAQQVVGQWGAYYIKCTTTIRKAMMVVMLKKMVLLPPTKRFNFLASGEQSYWWSHRHDLRRLVNAVSITTGNGPYRVEWSCPFCSLSSALYKAMKKEGGMRPANLSDYADFLGGYIEHGSSTYLAKDGGHYWPHDTEHRPVSELDMVLVATKHFDWIPIEGLTIIVREGVKVGNLPKSKKKGPSLLFIDDHKMVSPNLTTLPVFTDMKFGK